ncbi:unnamed protein product [Nippostrongylus brasiliensis]|uniref:Secreted protein n=1 Tax=Nippostrongylus brasiliensis TaxID=27835 RepID=A0A0N4Y7C8_NIPBR|nr:unnamed protein product [Nippostrongylus brasiliensis]
MIQTSLLVLTRILPCPSSGAAKSGIPHTLTPDVIVIPETETISIGPKQSMDTSSLSIDSLPIDDLTTWSDDMCGTATFRQNNNDNRISRDSAVGLENCAYKDDSS